MAVGQVSGWGIPFHFYTTLAFVISLRCEPAYVKYQFHCEPEHRTPSRPHAPDIEWQDSHVILLGTIDRELLMEYLRGPPLVAEVHDRDRRIRNERDPAVFGQESRDEVLGTHAFSTGGNSVKVCF